MTAVAHKQEDDARLGRSGPLSLIGQFIEKIRPQIADRSVPLKTRLRLFWSAAKAARDLAASDAVRDEFLELAAETGLRADLGRHADEDLRHVLSWAAHGMNPFETGPLT
jgi:hypothetical protein